MDNEQLILEHLVELKSGQAELSARMGGLEKAVLGDGQPGLVQKVEALEAHQNKVTGGVKVAGVVGAGLWGLLEYLFHYVGKGGK